MNALSFAQVQGVRDSFTMLARWCGLPIAADHLDGTQIVPGGVASLLKFAEPMIDADGELGEFSCYTPSQRRFAIHPTFGEGPWRTSENTLGAMVNPTDLDQKGFAQACYRYLLAKETGECFEADWLDEPVLWPETITRPEDLKRVRRFIPDLRPMETIVHAANLLGTNKVVARLVPGASWRELDWRDGEGRAAQRRPANETAVTGLKTWRMFLDGFLDRVVPFTLDAEDRRATGRTRGILRPASILIVGVERTGRANWGEGIRADTLIPDSHAQARMRRELGRISGEDLREAGLDPRTVRAIRGGRTPSRRNADAIRKLVQHRARAAAGFSPDRSRPCSAPGCGEALVGRQRSFCTKHADYPGSRRRAWREAASG